MVALFGDTRGGHIKVGVSLDGLEYGATYNSPAHPFTPFPKTIGRGSTVNEAVRDLWEKLDDTQAQS